MSEQSERFNPHAPAILRLNRADSGRMELVGGSGSVSPAHEIAFPEMVD